MFQWTGVHVNDQGPKTCYRLDGVEVARITRRVDVEDGWVALLNQHLVGQPRIIKPCTDFETGKRGIELWAERHRERLEYEVGRINALRPSRSWLPSSSRNA